MTNPDPSTWPPAWADPIVIIAGNPWSGLASSDRHVATHLSRVAPILYVDPPTNLWPQRIAPELGNPLPNVIRMTPHAPRGVYRPVIHRLLPRIVAHSVNRYLSASGRSARAVLVSTPSTALQAVRAERRVLFATDDWVAGADLMRLPASRMRWVRRRHIATADTVIAVSEVLAAAYRAGGHRNVVVIPNGCDAALLDTVDTITGATDVALPGPIAGFVGNISDRIDLAMLEAVAGRGCSLLLIGPRQAGFGGRRFDELVQRPNVQWLGARPYESIPSYLRVIDVGLTPYTRSAFNLASSPLKTIEYLASGRGSVSTDLPAVRTLGTDLVVIADDPAAFADAVERQLSVPRDDVLISARRDAAQPHDWDRRAEEIGFHLGVRRMDGAS